jgi:hypothetical protein
MAGWVGRRGDIVTDVARRINPTCNTPIPPDMVTHMKTTIELPDALFAEAKRVAEVRGITLKALIERALRDTLAMQRPEAPFRLQKHTFGGEGLNPELVDGSWDEIRARAYEGRGG